MIETNGEATTKDRFRFRGFISVITAVSFIGLVVTGLVLFIKPPGRIANWGGWTVWGLTKDQWASMHVWSGVTILIAGAFHIYLNWRALMSYFKSRPRRRFALRWQWILAAVFYVGVMAGTLAMVPPFSSLVNLQHDIKQSWEQADRRAPLPHAELLTLAELAKQTDAALDNLVSNLEAAGITVESTDTTVGDLAKIHRMTPENLYRIAVGKGHPGRGQGRGRGRGGVGGRGRGAGQGDSPPGKGEYTAGRESGGGSEGRGGRGQGGGMGRKTLRQFCTDEGIELSVALEKFRGKNIEARANMTMREIADEAGIHPRELRAVLGLDE